MLLNGITLSWATPFDAAELGARMEAYVETKALVLVFKLCVQRAQSEAPLGRLFPELIEMIATEVHDAAFKKKLKIWHKDLFCCANVCRPSEHLSAEQRKSLRDDYKLELRSEHEDDSGSDSDCGCGNHFDDYLAELGVGQDEHIDAVETTLAKVENNSYAESSGNFAKCRKIIAEDFGLEAYFTVFRDFEAIGTWANPPVTTIFAYLILPATHSTLRTSSGHETVSYCPLPSSTLRFSTPNTMTCLKWPCGLSNLHRGPLANNLQALYPHLSLFQMTMVTAGIALGTDNLEM